MAPASDPHCCEIRNTLLVNLSPLATTLVARTGVYLRHYARSSCHSGAAFRDRRRVRRSHDRARAADPLAPVTVLVGQTLVKRYLPRMLAQRGIAHINVRFVLADELALQLAPGGAVACRELSPNAERLLVRFAAQAAGELFRRDRRGDGFTDALRRLFRELERGGFSPETWFGERGGRVGEATSAHDLSRMYAAFQRRRLELGSRPGRRSMHPPSRRRSKDRCSCTDSGSLRPRRRLIEQIAATATTALCSCRRSDSDADDAHAAFRYGSPTLDADRALLPMSPSIATTQLARRRLPHTASADRRGRHRARQRTRHRAGSLGGRPRVPGVGARRHRLPRDGRHLSQSRAVPGVGRRDLSRSEGRDVPARWTPALDSPARTTPAAAPRFARAMQHSRAQRVMEFLTETHIPASTLERYPRLRPSEWEAFTREAGVVAGIDQWLMRLQRLASEKRAASGERAVLVVGEPCRSRAAIAGVCRRAARAHLAATPRPRPGKITSPSCARSRRRTPMVWSRC